MKEFINTMKKEGKYSYDDIIVFKKRLISLKKQIEEMEELFTFTRSTRTCDLDLIDFDDAQLVLLEQLKVLRREYQRAFLNNNYLSCYKTMKEKELEKLVNDSKKD